MKNYKIIMIVSHFRPQITGGEIYNYKLYTYLTSKFSQVDVVSLYDTPFRSRYGFMLRNLWFLKILKNCNENTIILEDCVRSSDLLLLNMFTRITRGVFNKCIKIIPVVYHTYFNLQQSKFKQDLKLFHEYSFLNNSDKIIVISEFTKREVQQILKHHEKDILIAHPGLNILPRKYTPKINSNINLLFVGSVTQRKDVETLINAFEILINNFRFKDLYLHIVGDLDKERDYSNMLMDLCKHINLDNTIKFYGRIEDDSLADLYSLSDIFVFPSLLEGFGMVLVEAMSYKLPIVATNVGAIPFLVKDGVNGYLVPPRDPERLAISIKKLIDSPQDRETIGELNLKISEEFNWEKTFEKIEKFIA